MNDESDPARTPIHVFDIATPAGEKPQVEVRQVTLVEEQTRKPGRVSLLRVDLGPALKKIDAMEAGQVAPPTGPMIHRPDDEPTLAG